MKTLLNRLYLREILSKEEAKTVLYEISDGAYNLAQVTSFISSYCSRVITVDELDGFREAMLDLCVKVAIEEENVIDVCGTGGDGKDTFNISTLSAFVLAGAGYKVAKHGNYGVSSGCGSSNVMEYLGYEFTNNTSILKKQLAQSNICFFHAPLFHPAMKFVAPIRKELGVRTFFNMLGPLINPAQPNCQSVGVFSLELARLYAYLYQRTDKKFSILYDIAGYDEISLTNKLKVYDKIGEHLLSPEDLGFIPLNASALKGGKDVAESAQIFLSVLKNQATSSQRSAVVANAAIAIRTIDSAKSIEESNAIALHSIESGQALTKFKQLLS